MRQKYIQALFIFSILSHRNLTNATHIPLNQPGKSGPKMTFKPITDFSRPQFAQKAPIVKYHAARFPLEKYEKSIFLKNLDFDLFLDFWL